MSFDRKNNNPYLVVKKFEDSVAEYTGSKYAVSVDSCTNALFLCLMYQKKLGNNEKVIIPSNKPNVTITGKLFLISLKFFISFTPYLLI